MYACILNSRKVDARRFRKWVTSEVLPSLRRTGRYQLHDHEVPDQALDYDPTRLTAGVTVVREARRLFGPMAARSLWRSVGLPPCVADAEAIFDGDALAAPLKAWLADKQQCTIIQAATGMGMTQIDHTTRHRIGQLLRLWGWTGKTQKLNGKAVVMWTRPAPLFSDVEAGESA
jgi:hypothetical protein